MPQPVHIKGVGDKISFSVSGIGKQEMSNSVTFNYMIAETSR